MNVSKFDLFKLSELIGIIIGDGNIYYKPDKRKYYFEITGDPKLEKSYFDYISKLVQSLLGKKPTIRTQNRGLKLRLYSKNFVEFLIKELGIPHGRDKGTMVKIPDRFISQEWKILKMCIRGIADTDGSLFLSKKGNNLNYPCIEIVTTSKPLAFQLKTLLSNKFRIGFRKYSRGEFRKQYILSVNGDNMVNQWIEDIGFSNQRKSDKIIGKRGI